MIDGKQRELRERDKCPTESALGDTRPNRTGQPSASDGSVFHPLSRCKDVRLSRVRQHGFSVDPVRGRNPEPQGEEASHRARDEQWDFTVAMHMRPAQTPAITIADPVNPW